MNVVLEAEGPLNVDATLARYRLWGEDPANRLGTDVFRRVLCLDGRLAPYEVRWTGGVDDTRLLVTVPVARGARIREAVAAEVRRVFGLDFDLPGFYRLAKGDPVLAPLVDSLYGLRPTLAATPLEMLVHAIAAQQVNLPFAFVCRARLVRRYGTPMVIGGEPLWAFPHAAALAAARVRDLRRLQFSTRKAEYIRDLARAVTTGALDLDELAAAPDAAVIERLTAVRGLGRWTADWFLARCLGRGAVCPAGDLAVRKAFARHHGRGRTLSEAAIRRRAAAWGPYQNLAIHYLLAGMRLAAPPPRRRVNRAGDGA
jgi:DNA-3-methyladenine glycosylase II